MWPVLTVDFMSSEESNAEDVPTEQDPISCHESDQEQSATLKRKEHGLDIKFHGEANSLNEIG